MTNGSDVQIWQVVFLVFLQFLVRRLLRILQFKLLSVPTPAQGQIVIADNRMKTAVPP